MDPESFFHVALKVDDIETSTAFYRDQLGGDVIDRGDDGQGPEDLAYAALEVADKRVYLFDRAPYEAAGLVGELPTGVLHYGFVVDDVDSTSRELLDAGVDFLMEPTTFGDLKVAFFSDPDGVRVELIEHLD